MAKRKGLPSQEYYRQHYKGIQQNVFDALDTLEGAYREKREREFNAKQLRYNRAQQIFPEIAFKKEFYGWEKSGKGGNAKFESMMDYADDMVDSIQIGKNWVPSGTSLSPYAEEELVFGIDRETGGRVGLDPSIKVSDNDFNVYSQWLFGDGEIARSQRWGGLINKSADELSEVEFNDLTDKGIIKEKEDGWEDWDKLRQNKSLLKDRFSNFKTGFVNADDGNRYWDETELMDLENAMINKKVNKQRQIMGLPSYTESSTVLANFDEGRIENMLLAGPTTVDNQNNQIHGGYSFMDGTTGNMVTYTDDSYDVNFGMLMQTHPELAKAVSSDAKTLRRHIAENPSFMASLKSQNSKVHMAVEQTMDALDNKNKLDARIDLSNLDTWDEMEEMNQLADVSLLLADDINREIDFMFDKLKENPSLWRRWYDNDTDWNAQTGVQTDLLDKASALVDKFTIKANPLYNENIKRYLDYLGNGDARQGMFLMVNSILTNRTQDAENDEYFALPTIQDIYDRHLNVGGEGREWFRTLSPDGHGGFVHSGTGETIKLRDLQLGN